MNTSITKHQTCEENKSNIASDCNSIQDTDSSDSEDDDDKKKSKVQNLTTNILHNVQTNNISLSNDSLEFIKVRKGTSTDMCIQEIKNYESTIEKLVLETVQRTFMQSNQIHEKL